MMDEYFNGSYDTTAGVRITKPRHDLYTIDIVMFTEAVRWVSRELVKMGYEPVEARLIPEREVWCYYDPHGEHIFTAPHELIEHLWDALRFQPDGA